MIRFLTAALVLLFLTPARAGEMIDGPVLADVVKVRDGDSIDVVAHVWPGSDVRVSVRVRGIDTPELRGKCPGEIILAEQARDRMTQLLEGRPVTLSRISGGKYFGRVLADVTSASGENVGVEMLRSGHARPYRGRKRKSWCDKTAMVRP